MEELCTYGFWFWQNKFTGILVMLEFLAGYEMDIVEPAVIKDGLKGTNEDIWFEWRFPGKKHTIHMKFAYDEEEGPDMIHISIKTDCALKEKLEAMNLFQCLFKELEPEHTNFNW